MVIYIAIKQSNFPKKMRMSFTFGLLTISLFSLAILAYKYPFYIDLLLYFFLLFLLIFGIAHRLKIRLGSRFTVFVVFVIVFSFIAPYVSACLGFAYITSTIGETENLWEKATHVSEYVRSITISLWKFDGWKRRYVTWHRADSDFQKYLVVGAGACGEMAYATKMFLDHLHIGSHVASFPGEDHAFVEVRLDNTWLVLDPGYQLNLITREERGQKRLEEMGGLSYVVAYIDQDTVEITQKYVPTDKIVIKITDNGMPVADAKIVLSHIFMGETKSLPAFY
ncbi:MAG: hypothetical protein DRN20_06830, partial [Thermoplasmata archaeon]